ncbi:DUF4116 domain-containing protein [Paraburkholderia sp. D15]|uniref:DUF4116 domain-containing protein n=1 Tax=Paraburkholderia sp. D15 TaxID=2880218 RepID=UPI00247A4763|nr:DUF4116 domain-containing protein [Paraburkholderia sp. D15]WGS54487.1 DUF4116 domain-containing protein [Paraburkholderia sp. D15]
MTQEELNRYYELDKRFGQRELDDKPNEIEDWYDIPAVVEALKNNNHMQESFVLVRPDVYKNRDVALGLLTQDEMDDHTGAQIMAIHGDDRLFVLEALQQTDHKWLYPEVDDSLKNDKELAYHAILQFPQNLRYVGDELRADLWSTQGFYVDKENLNGLHYDDWNRLQRDVSNVLGSELGLSVHEEKFEYENLHTLYKAECMQCSKFHSDLRCSIRDATSFTKNNLKEFARSSLATNEEILGTFHKSVTVNHERQFDRIKNARDKNLLRPSDEPVDVPTFKPLEISLGDVIKHYGMTEKTINLHKLEPDLRKSVNSYFMHEKMQRDLTQKSQPTMTQSRKMKI